MTRTGGQVLVSALERNGIDLAFCLPGESFLPVLDALYDSPIRLVTSRHEQGASNAAEAFGKLTGRPGICLVTRGPGATQAAVGVHTARQDSTPMLLLVGQVPRAFRGREAWQELDYEAVFGGIAKGAWEIDSADRMPEHMGEAFSLALSGRPGPVVLSLPEDVLAETTAVEDSPPVEIESPAPSLEDVARLRELLVGAARPLVVVGEGGWTQQTGDDVRAACEANELPVACAFRCQDFVDNRSPSYVGVLGVAMDESLATRLRDADLVLAIGGRLGEVPTRRYTLVEPPRPRQTLVHVHPAADELGSVYETDLEILSGLPEFAAALRALDPGPVEVEGVDDERACRVPAHPRARADGGPGRPRRDHGVLAGSPPAGCHSDLWGRQLYGLGTPFRTVHAVRDPARAALGLDGLRPPGCGRREARPSGSDRRLLHGRWRLRHELARARHRRAVRAPDRHRSREQRHVRDHPHAPGAHVPAARDRDRSREPGLSGPRAGVRRPRRASRTNRRLRGCVRARARIGQAGGPRAAGRSGADQPAREAERTPREGGLTIVREEIRVDGLAEPISHFTDAVRAGGFLHVSGIVAVDGDDRLVGGEDVVAQTRQVFENMRAVLEAGGCGFEDVVKITIFLTEIDDRPLINPLRQEVFGATRPASTLVEVPRLAVPGAKIEIECVAFVP